jgi:hypothetical protein
MRKSKRKAMRNVTRKAMRNVTRKAMRNVKSVRKVMRKVKTRRAKHRTMKGGDYETSIVDDELELVPILADDSKDLSVSVPGFGTVGMKAYRQYMQDLDTRGSAQM